MTMSGEATIEIQGNVGRDPELRQTQSGKRVAGVTVLVTGRRKQGDEWVDGETVAYECTLWDDEAEYAVVSLPKGTAVLVVGRVVGLDTYESKGETRAKVKVAVEAIGPSLKRATAQVSRRSKGQGDGQGAPQQQAGSWGQEAPQQAATAPQAAPQGWATSQPGQEPAQAWGAPGTGYNDSTPF